jgi:hypothetical protein
MERLWHGNDSGKPKYFVRRESQMDWNEIELRSLLDRTATNRLSQGKALC